MKKGHGFSLMLRIDTDLRRRSFMLAILCFATAGSS